MTIEEIKGKFYGPYKIEAVFADEAKTYLGGECINILLDNETTKFLPKKVVEVVITEEKSDFTEVQKKLFNDIVPQVLTIFAEYDLSMLDCQVIMGKIDVSLEDNFQRGISKTFGVENSKEITLMQIEKVLTKEEKKDV